MARPREWTDERIAELRRLIQRKATPARAGAVLKITPQAARQAANRYGIEWLVRG